MPPWLFFYLTVIVVVAALAVRDDLQEKTPIPFVVAELIAIILLTVTALAFWLPFLSSCLGTATPVTYSAAVV